MNPELTDKIKEAIAEGALETAIFGLLELGQSGSASAQEDILLLEGRLRQLQQKEARGVVDAEKASVELNQIREQMLTIVQVHGRSPEERTRATVRRRLRWILPLSAYLLIGLSASYWLFQPQTGFRIAADLLVERVTFQYESGSFDFGKGKVKSAYVQNYEKARIEGNRLQMVGTNGFTRIDTLQHGELLVKSNEAIPGIGLRLAAVQLERISTAAGATLTMSQPDLEANKIELTIQQSQPLSTAWIYQDRLELVAEYATISDLEQELVIVEPTTLEVFPPEQMAREIQMKTYAGTSHLSLDFERGFALEGKGLMMTQPTFYQPLEAVAVPTILAGSIQIGDLDKNPLKSIELMEGEALDLYTDHALDLRAIRFTENGIHLAFTGQVDQIETGRDHYLRNPNRLEWWWHRQKLWLIAGSIIFLGTGAFIPRGIRTSLHKT